MKNIKKDYQLKKCIFMIFDEFKDIVEKITDGLATVEYEYGGIYISHTEKAEETDTYWNESMTETLSKYFDVEVTSYHADDCDVIGIWICYKG